MRFQSDPMEGCFRQYHQMSGRQFLITEKDINISEKILKIKTIIREGVEIDSTVLVTEQDPIQVAKLMKIVEKLVGGAKSLQFNDDSFTKLSICTETVAKAI